LSKRPPKSTKTCVVCGKTFPCFPSDKTVTYGKECSKIHRSRIHMGLSNKWSEESRTRKAAQGKTANLALGTPAAQKSPKFGRQISMQVLMEIAIDRFFMWRRSNVSPSSLILPHNYSIRFDILYFPKRISNRLR